MKQLSPAFAELTQDALLKAFWFKPSLRQFLIQHRVSEAALARWAPEQSKRDYIYWLWPLLLKNDAGKNVILSMARSLAEMRHFPDLERKEDTKIRIPEAVEAINRLKVAVAEINATIRESNRVAHSRKEAEAFSAAKKASEQSLDKLAGALMEIFKEAGTSEAGYKFEKWIYELAVFFELDSRPGYWADGRQIDGAVTIDGTTFLIEAKCLKAPIGAPEVDGFMAKINSKADNTMGLFFSISGFNSGAINAAAKTRTPMLFIDSEHLFALVLRGALSLPQLVGRIKRHAHQTGEPYLRVADF